MKNKTVIYETFMFKRIRKTTFACNIEKKLIIEDF